MSIQFIYYAVIGLSLLAAAVSFFTMVQLVALRKRLEPLFQGSKGVDLEGVLAEQGRRMRDFEQEFRHLRDDVARLDVMATSSIQKVGIVRFNPFDDTGGDQSFAIALLDSQDNGIVVSSLHSREGTRIYGKAVVHRESRHHLSDEEREAIRRAVARE